VYGREGGGRDLMGATGGVEGLGVGEGYFINTIRRTAENWFVSTR
jgi:hypothetical protein